MYISIDQFQNNCVVGKGFAKQPHMLLSSTCIKEKMAFEYSIYRVCHYNPCEHVSLFLLYQRYCLKRKLNILCVQEKIQVETRHPDD